jgi:hypothetical protein
MSTLQETPGHRASLTSCRSRHQEYLLRVLPVSHELALSFLVFGSPLLLTCCDTVSSVAPFALSPPVS